MKILEMVLGVVFTGIIFGVVLVLVWAIYKDLTDPPQKR